MSKKHITSTRRGVLSGLGVGSLAATAGCLTTLPSFGQRVRFGAVDEPAPDGAAYRRWLPAGERTNARYHVPGNRGEQTLGGPIEDGGISNSMEYVGVDLTDVEYVCDVNGVFVLRTDPDRDRIEQVLDELEYRQIDSYRGFERYERPSTAAVGFGTASVAVGDDAVLYTGDGPAHLEPIVDAGAEESARVATQREPIMALFETVGAYPVTNISYSDVGGRNGPVVARADQYAFDDEAAYAVRTRLYGDETEISRREIESQIESRTDSTPYALDAHRVDLRIDEPFVTIAAEFDHDEFREQFGPTTNYPLVSWDINYHETDEEVKLVHLAGETVDPDRLEIQGEGLSGELPQFGETYRKVSPGDSIVISVAGNEGWSVGLAVVDQTTGDTHPLFAQRDPN